MEPENEHDPAKLAQDAHKTAAKIAGQVAELLKKHPPPVHVDVIARMMGMMIGCLPEKHQEQYFKATIEMAALYTAEYEKEVEAIKTAQRH